MHPLTLIHALKDAGMTCRSKAGKLMVNPVALLTGELRQQVITHRDALLAWLEGAEEDEARMEALAEEAARHNPFLEPEPEGRGTVLVRVSGEGERPRYVAIDPDYWADLERWAAEVRQSNARKAAQKKPAARPAGRKGKGGGFAGGL